MLTRFDRHIIRRVLTGFVGMIVALVVFFVVLHYLEYIDDFMDRGAEMRAVFFTYYPNFIPDIVRLTSPLALFLSCVWVTGRLSQELQLAALQTAGVSLYRLALPYLLVGLLVTVGMFFFNGYLVPKTNQTVLAFERQYLNDKGQRVDVSDIHRQNRPGEVLVVGFYDEDGRTAHRVSLEAFRDGQQLVRRTDAERMTWQDSLGVWRMFNTTTRSFGPDGLERYIKTAEIDTLLNVYPRDLARTERDVESMTIPIAIDYIDSIRRSGAGGLGRPLVTYYGKFTYPLANLILALLAVPLAAVRRRGGQTSQVAVGLLTAFLYLALQKVAEPFGYSGDLSPLLVTWLPHVIFGVLVVLLFLRVRK